MSLKGNGIVGIRREDKNKWERRAPLTPENVRNLVQSCRLRFLVQPSSRRIFSDQEYVDAGAEITEDLSSASLILAVKEVTPSVLIPERTYLMFAHVIKAQPENMHLLDMILKKKVRLIDYECITEGGVRGGQRLVAFGRFAGLAGAVDFLRGLGERLLAIGFQTPFLRLCNPAELASLPTLFESGALQHR
ncbi:hypothetical protein CYMTET_15829 [Cymbomonas tetramitiformis]|uniref:Alanine dehydrogenase/pyridine nucleotide transhydrogenase N-terminal domain-containing protein n=1 Tax=Cymbomonas tetramitiformis TaxID=36881 RepID=A0AAE0L8K9_9CHLO|nr:hypothetical protein CYMTET_15829 [Cymbomonas tetramitiformis]